MTYRLQVVAMWIHLNLRKQFWHTLKILYSPFQSKYEGFIQLRTNFATFIWRQLYNMKLPLLILYRISPLHLNLDVVKFAQILISHFHLEKKKRSDFCMFSLKVETYLPYLPWLWESILRWVQDPDFSSLDVRERCFNTKSLENSGDCSMALFRRTQAVLITYVIRGLDISLMTVAVFFKRRFVLLRSLPKW